jgi:hypothetical protein
MLTKKEALEKSQAMWTWLAQHPDKEKYHYFKEKQIGYDYKPQSECYLCEFTLSISSTAFINCTLCPFIDKWGKKSSSPTINNHCRCKVAESPYQIWCTNPEDYKLRTKMAQKIADLCTEALAEFNPTYLDLTIQDNIKNVLTCDFCFRDREKIYKLTQPHSCAKIVKSEG